MEDKNGPYDWKIVDGCTGSLRCENYYCNYGYDAFVQTFSNFDRSKLTH